MPVGFKRSVRPDFSVCNMLDTVVVIARRVYHADAPFLFRSNDDDFFFRSFSADKRLIGLRAAG
jgi:hypothetical protein